MQTIRHRQKNAIAMVADQTKSRKDPKLGLVLGALLLSVGVLLAFSLLSAMPSQAYAKSYTMPKVDIVAEAATDGSLNVVERRTFDFDGSFRMVWWTFSGLPENVSLKVNGVSSTPVDASGNARGETEQLPEVSFVLSWRDSNDGLPANDAYSVDIAQNSVYAIFNASDERRVFTLDYTFVNGVQAYKDIGEVYWKYISDHWAEASENVSMTLTLPVPGGAIVTPGENVRAWGHGPLDGTVAINDDGSITYKVGHVNAGQYAEARVVFPVEWLTNLSEESAAAHKGEARLDTIMKEEQTWADEANRDRTLSLAFVIGCVLLAVSILVWAIRSYFKWGKEYPPDFTEEYWRDVPSPQDHPAVIARLWRWNKESSDDFTATLMHLSHIGAIQINKGSYDKPGVFGSKVIDDYYLTRISAVADSLTDPIDIKAMDLLFGQIADGADSLWFGSIEKYGKDNAEEFVDGMKSWQGIVEAETNKRDFFEIKGQRKQFQMVGAAIVLLAAAIISVIILENFIPLIFLIPVAIALFFIANNMPRRSHEGNNLDAKCKALKNWLKDFSALDERPPTDVKVWGEFMVYAFIFGIAKQVIQALQLKVPELFQEDASFASTSYVPWWFWYSSSYGTGGSVMPSASDMLQTSVANTISTAQSALSGASGNFSSGGGFGGGFSGGGGGGFGGGGGAR